MEQAIKKTNDNQLNNKAAVNFLTSETEIVERAKTDEAAFGILYDFYFPRIYGYIFKRCGSREACEDIVSTTFLKALANLKKYEPRGYTFGAWLYRIATNNLADYYRKNKPETRVELNEAEGSDDGQGFTGEIIKKEERAAIEKALRKIPARYQEIIHLRYFAELEIEEIAGALKISKAHASVLIHRALKCFKKKYEE
jgi:RNA polymerase sigma-70 factor, ECF subfamily